MTNGNRATAATTALLALSTVAHIVDAKLADRSRVVAARKASGRYDRHRDNGRPIDPRPYLRDR